MRKRRTKEHIIGDLGYNYVERQILLAKYTMTLIQQDYGYDGIITTYDYNGEIENGYILIQVKATQSIKYSKKNKGFKFSISRKDLNHWAKDPSIVLLVLYDEPNHLAYFIDIQYYLRKKNINLLTVVKYLDIFFPIENLFNAQSVIKFRNLKNKNL